MIVPFWSWNLSDTTHVRPHTKFQLVWAINNVFTRGGHDVPPPSLKCVAGTPSLLGLNIRIQIVFLPNCSAGFVKNKIFFNACFPNYGLKGGGSRPDGNYS